MRRQNSRRNPGPVSSNTRAAMFCICPRLNDDDGRPRGRRWPPPIAKLPALDTGSSSAKVTTSVCVCVRGCVAGTRNRTPLVCLHLSRLITLCSISFEWETLRFWGLPSERFKCRVGRRRQVSLLCHRFFKSGFSNLLPENVTHGDGAQYYFQPPTPPFLPPPPPPPPSSQVTKTEAGHRGFTHFKFLLLIEWGKKNK